MGKKNLTKSYEWNNVERFPITIPAAFRLYAIEAPGSLNFAAAHEPETSGRGAQKGVYAMA